MKFVVEKNKIPRSREGKLNAACMFLWNVVLNSKPVALQKSGEIGRNLHFTYVYRFKLFLLFVTIVNLMLAPFDRSYYGNYDASVQTIGALNWIEVVCVLVFWLDVLLRFSIFGPRSFFVGKWNVLVLSVVSLMTLDVVMTFIAIFSNNHYDGKNTSNTNSMRMLLKVIASLSGFSSILRPLLLIERSRKMKSFASTAIKTIPKLLTLICLLSIFLFFSAIIAVLLFSGLTSTKTTYDNHFNSYFDSVLSLFVLLTLSNYPAVAAVPFETMPYTTTIFFTSFIIIGFYLLITVIVAVVYSQFKAIRMKKSIVNRARNVKSSAIAFQYICDKDGFVDIQTWNELMKRMFPSITNDTYFKHMFDYLDVAGDKKLDISEFIDAIDLLRASDQLKTTEIDQLLQNDVDDFNIDDVDSDDDDDDENENENDENKKKKKKKKKKTKLSTLILASRKFNFCSRLALFINIISSIFVVIHYSQIQSHLDSNSNEARISNNNYYFIQIPSSFRDASLCFFVFELYLNISSSNGVKNYLLKGSFWNLTDMICIILPGFARIVLLLLNSIKGDNRDINLNMNSLVERLLMCVTMLSVTRIVLKSNTLKSFVGDLASVLPILFYVIFLTVCIMYSYSILGMLIFDGLLPNNSPNFNSFANSMLTLFQIMTLQAWEQIMNSCVRATNVAAVLYFVSFVIFVVMILLNMLIGMVIDIFVSVLDSQQQNQDIVEKFYAKETKKKQKEMEDDDDDVSFDGNDFMEGYDDVDITNFVDEIIMNDEKPIVANIEKNGEDIEMGNISRENGDDNEGEGDIKQIDLIEKIKQKQNESPIHALVAKKKRWSSELLAKQDLTLIRQQSLMNLEFEKNGNYTDTSNNNNGNQKKNLTPTNTSQTKLKPKTIFDSPSSPKLLNNQKQKTRITPKANSILPVTPMADNNTPISTRKSINTRLRSSPSLQLQKTPSPKGYLSME